MNNVVNTLESIPTEDIITKEIKSAASEEVDRCCLPDVPFRALNRAGSQQDYRRLLHSCGAGCNLQLASVYGEWAWADSSPESMLKLECQTTSNWRQSTPTAGKLAPHSRRATYSTLVCYTNLCSWKDAGALIYLSLNRFGRLPLTAARISFSIFLPVNLIHRCQTTFGSTG
jgi:hypothetical protein